MKKLRILLTCYGKWSYDENSPANPSQVVAECLASDTLDLPDLVEPIKIFLAPSNYEKCIKEAIKQINDFQPDIVVSMGEFPGRAVITVEMLAKNWVDGSRYHLTDDSGVMPHGKIIPNGVPAYTTTLPIYSMVRSMRDVGVPADISDSSGSFLCNVLFYGIMHHLQSSNLNHIEAGYIHLPCLPESAALDNNIGTPSMSVQTQVKGIRAALKAAVKMYGKDGDDKVIIRGPL